MLKYAYSLYTKKDIYCNRILFLSNDGVFLQKIADYWNYCEYGENMKNKVVCLTNKELDIIDRIEKKSKNEATYRKVLFHIHTPASYDYKYFGGEGGNYSQMKGDFYNLSVNDLADEINADGPLISEKTFENSSFSEAIWNSSDIHEKMAYLLMAKKILESEIYLALVTDHNTFSGFLKLENAISILCGSKRFPVHTDLLLGIEITCADCHVVGIFDSRKGSANRINTLSKWLNNFILDEETGSFKTSLEVIEMIKEEGGIPYIAHINSSNLFKSHSLSKGYKTQLFNSNNLHVLGVNSNEHIEQIRNQLKYYNINQTEHFCFVLDEDSHEFSSLAKKTFYILGTKRNFEMIRNAFHDPSFSVLLSIPQTPLIGIKGIFITPFHNEKGFFIEKKDTYAPFVMSFSDSLTCLIGSRGTGKSTILNMIDFILAQRQISIDILRFFSKNKEIIIYVRKNNDFYIFEYLSPNIEDEDDEEIVLSKFGVHMRIENSHIEDDYLRIKRYIIQQMLTVKKIVDERKAIELTYGEKIDLLEDLYDQQYSINDLVEQSKTTAINDYILQKLNPSFDGKIVVNGKKKEKQLITQVNQDIYSKLLELKDTAYKFNRFGKNLIKISTEKMPNIENENITKLINMFSFLNVKRYKNYNISSLNLKNILWEYISETGVIKFIENIIDNNTLQIQQKLVTRFSFDRDERYIFSDLKWLDEEENYKSFLTDLSVDLKKDLKKKNILDYFKNVYSFEHGYSIFFNVNSNMSKNSNSQFRKIQQLSLGQKVVAILDFIFAYGEYADDNRPLIIDQPEDNLDNSYIYENLVMNLKNEKTKRQVIIATHSSTIVTNAKAESIIVMESENNRAWCGISGYPYEEKIIKAILKYLEGGIDSFKHKEFIYSPILKK